MYRKGLGAKRVWGSFPFSTRNYVRGLSDLQILEVICPVHLRGVCAV